MADGDKVGQRCVNANVFDSNAKCYWLFDCFVILVAKVLLPNMIAIQTIFLLPKNL